ncbi:hypothetical protein Tco_1134757 [Tanacetum coccineum]
METIGIPPDKHETDENEEGKPLSAGKSSLVSSFCEPFFHKAHLYVLTTIQMKLYRISSRRELANDKRKVYQKLSLGRSTRVYWLNESRDDYNRKDYGGVVILKIQVNQSCSSRVHANTLVE